MAEALAVPILCKFSGFIFEGGTFSLFPTPGDVCTVHVQPLLHVMYSKVIYTVLCTDVSSIFI